MKYSEICESKTNGTFIGVKLTDVSNEQLVIWCEENNINCEPFHITLIFDQEKEIPYIPVRYDPPLVLNPKTYKFDIFEGALVLRFDSDTLCKKHFMLRKKHDIKWDHDDYKPHITLDYKWDAVKSNRLQRPKFPIKLSYEYKEGFDK